MGTAVITGTGLFTPNDSISNDELVASFNEYVTEYNKDHEKEILAGKVEALQESSSSFIEKASGIKSRFVMDKKNIIDPAIMHPVNLEKDIDNYSLQCNMSVTAAKSALEAANVASNEIDMIIAACSNMPRPYPALSIEVQEALQANDCSSFDLNVACASAAFALHTAKNAITSGAAKTILIVNPEICSAHLNFRDRDSHFIFGDACTAMVVQDKGAARADSCWEIVDSKIKTQYSRNIHNNFGFLSLTNTEEKPRRRKLFSQEGRKVFKDIVPLVSSFISKHIEDNEITSDNIKRLWLHQANKNMNDFIAKKILGHEASFNEAPIILDSYANTSSAGSIIAFHKHSNDLKASDLGVISAFGAGYSVGSVIVKKIG